MFFMGGLLLVLVAGQFGDVWNTRLARARAVNRYLDERLAALTKNHYLLRISHARLENDLLARPTTLRDTLSQLRAVALQDAMNGGNTGPLAGAQPMLQVVAQACQVEARRCMPAMASVSCRTPWPASARPSRSTSTIRSCGTASKRARWRICVPRGSSRTRRRATWPSRPCWRGRTG
jgi:hypothetical protein